MGLLDFLGFGKSSGGSTDAQSAETIHRIAAALDRLEPDKARYIACFAYLLGRVAHADLEVSEAETREMERIVEGLGGLPSDQAALVVQIAKTQNKLFGGTDNHAVAREFNELATHPQKLSLLNCLFAVSSADQSISTVEDNEIRKISQELKLDHEDFVAARSVYREHLGVLRRPAAPDGGGGG